MIKSLFFFSLVLISTSVRGGSNAIGNGGELLSSRFINTGNAIYQTLREQNSALLTEEQMEAFRLSLLNSRVNAVSGPLRDNVGRVVDARYVVVDDQGVIEIDRDVWRSFFASRELVNQLVFHEYLRTINVDDDNYKVSSRLTHLNRAIDKVAGSTSDGKLVVNDLPDNFVYQDSSGAHRDGKTFTLSFGLGVDYQLAAFFKGDIFLNRNQQLELYQGVAGSSDDRMTHQTVAFKQFVGNTFYWAIGVGQRRFRYEVHDSFFQEYKEIPRDAVYTRSDITAEVYIGNQWQWQHLTLGVDWIGFATPIIVQNQSDGFDRGPQTLIITRGSIGVSF